MLQYRCARLHLGYLDPGPSTFNPYRTMASLIESKLHLSHLKPSPSILTSPGLHRP